MKIVHFAESYLPVINGAAVAIDTLSREQVDRGDSVEVFAPRCPGHTDRFPTTRFPSYLLPGHADYPLAWPWSPACRRRFEAIRPDVVHAHSPFALGQVARRWARRLGTPIITTYHTLYVEYAHYAGPFLAPPARAYLRRLSSGFCNACDALAVPTEPIREVLLGYGVSSPIHVIPTGLKIAPPLPPDPNFPRARFGVPKDARLALYAGRLAREKNLEFLLAAFDRCAMQLADAWLLLVGGGPEEASLRRLAAGLSSASRIRFAGPVDPTLMPQVYAGCDVFAFSSLFDTQGLVLTEAKAAGLPAVSVDAFGPSTVVRNGVDGLLTPPDESAFAEALVKILSDEKLRLSMRAAALEGIRRFSIEATADAYDALYREAIHRNASR